MSIVQIRVYYQKKKKSSDKGAAQSAVIKYVWCGSIAIPVGSIDQHAIALP